MDDRNIIALFFARSEQAVAALSERYGPMCMNIAKNILHNQQDAEECVNDAFFAVWNTIPPQTPNPLHSYVCRIVRNLAVKKYHANTAAKRNSSYDLALDELEHCIPASESVEHSFDALETARRIDQFLATLEPEKRILFIRRYWYADSLDDLAMRFHTSKHTISVRLNRIRKKLSAFLMQTGGL